MTAAGVVVTDANVALRRALPGRHQAETRQLWARWDAAGTVRLAPAVFAGEVTTALLRQVRHAGMPRPEAYDLLATLFQAVAIEPEDAPLARRAFDIADAIGAGKAYDSLYAALAERVGCELWTADERFWRAARARFPWVRWVGAAT
jgi:predicted nucleic acid-binding protein